MYVCNPIKMSYRYQFHQMRYGPQDLFRVCREAADPSLVMFKGRYYLFPSMTAGFLVSDDLVHWDFHRLAGLPIYDYAPDVRVIGDYLYFSASHRTKNCSFYRTKDPIHGPFEEIEGTFPFWDPNLFVDEDGKVYFYWGCSNQTPIYGVELDPETMRPKTEPVELIFGRMDEIGYERKGENHQQRSPEEIEAKVQEMVSQFPDASEKHLQMIRMIFGNDPFIEGAWMDKHNGKYYLQYAAPGTEYNIYADGVYVSDHPLGPFTLAKNNPYSYKPGGFLPGAGHGSTMRDKHGNWWHAATMRISVNHNFERRLGLWPAGFDADGELFCNQRYGDWPMKIESGPMDPWAKPEWMLLSWNKPARASSSEAEHAPGMAVDENVQTWWRAATNAPGEWIEVDLNQVCDVHAIQINFADDVLLLPLPDGAVWPDGYDRWIDEREHVTRWVLEGSVDGETYFVIEDRSQASTDLPHDLVVREEGFRARYIRLTVRELPYDQHACVSGLRVFGLADVGLPAQTSGVRAERQGELDLIVRWDADDAVGHNVLWGHAPDKLYHSYMVLGSHEVRIGALVKGQPVYVRVDAFNERGITEGEVIAVD